LRDSLRGNVTVMLKAAWKRCVLGCHSNVEKVCESQMALSREFQIVGARTRKARELKASFIQGTVKRINRGRMEEP